MAVGGVDVRVENQLVRFIPTAPVNHDAVISQLAGQKNGNIVIKALQKPRATIIIDEAGRIVVHGTHRVEAARAAAKELLLRLGLDDSGLQTELGPVIASFQFRFGSSCRVNEPRIHRRNFDLRSKTWVCNNPRH